MNVPRVLPVVAAVVCLAVLTGCGPVGVKSTSAQSLSNPALASVRAAQSSAVAAASEAEASASSAAAASSASAAAPAPFGGSKIFTDGIAVSVAAPKPYTPSAEAAGNQPGDVAFEVQVTITNGSPTNFDPSLIQVSAQAGGTEGSAVFDVNVGGTPDTQVPPGKSVTFPQIFAAPSMNDVIVQVTPGFDYAPALFEG